MNIIEKVRELVTGFPQIDTLHAEFAGQAPVSFTLVPTGDALLSEDVSGRQSRQHGFLLYAVFSGLNDFERVANSGVLLDLAFWLEGKVGETFSQTVGGTDFGCEITSLVTANGALYAAPQENAAGGIQYRLQITAQYTMEEE